MEANDLTKLLSVLFLILILAIGPIALISSYGADDNSNDSSSGGEDKKDSSDSGGGGDSKGSDKSSNDDSGGNDESDSQSKDKGDSESTDANSQDDQTSEQQDTETDIQEQEQDSPVIDTKPILPQVDEGDTEDKKIPPVDDNKKPENDPCIYGNTNVCEGSPDGKTCNEEKFDCLSDGKDGKPCTTGQCPGDDKPPFSEDCKKYNDKCKPYGDGDGGKGDGKKCGKWNDWCGKDGGGGKKHCGWWNNWCHHPKSDNWCKWHDCHHHTHSHTHTSGHVGDVTVKIELKYEETSKKNLDDMFLFIGDEYDRHLNLSDKPSTIKVDNLDIDGGDDFAVCLANEDSQNGDCTVVHADNDHDTVKAFLTVK